MPGPGSLPGRVGVYGGGYVQGRGNRYVQELGMIRGYVKGKRREIYQRPGVGTPEGEGAGITEGGRVGIPEGAGISEGGEYTRHWGLGMNTPQTWDQDTHPLY